jgi:predicted acetyltransferase
MARWLAGFVLACVPPYVTPGREYRVNEFFVLRSYRRRRVGKAGAWALFNWLPGKWEVGWLEGNEPAAAFWRRAVAEYTHDFEEASVLQTASVGIPGLHFDSVL